MIFDPNSGLPVFSPAEIKKVTLEYCVNLLTNREPKPAYIEVMKTKEELHNLRMQEVIFNDINELTLDMFNSALKHVSSTHGSKYKFILKAGPLYLNALYKLFLSVWESENIPDDWHRSQLVQLYKS